MSPVQEVKVSLIAALSQNRVIGREGKLPWNLPEDLKYFRRVTAGHPILMGRKTFESIGRVLPNRLNVVITRSAARLPKSENPSLVYAESLDQAIRMGRENALAVGKSEVFVIGGGEIYMLALPNAHRLYLTEVETEIQGDAYFPAVDSKLFKEISREKMPAQGTEPAFSFVVFERA